MKILDGYLERPPLCSCRFTPKDRGKRRRILSQKGREPPPQASLRRSRSAVAHKVKSSAKSIRRRKRHLREAADPLAEEPRAPGPNKLAIRYSEGRKAGPAFHATALPTHEHFSGSLSDRPGRRGVVARRWLPSHTDCFCGHTSSARSRGVPGGC